MGAATFYAVLTGLYLRFGETGRTGRIYRRSLSDVFDVLTYRQRYEALLRQTGRDALTGLLDRGRFDRDAPRAIAEAANAGRSISMLVIDIDHFKDINDQFGHAVGDEALRAIARELTAAMRENDRVYRYGGEEFIALCEGLPHAAAMLAGERLRIGIASLRVDGVTRAITASIGIATALEDGSDLRALFDAADSRLYAAKAAGRDRVRGRLNSRAEPVTADARP
jgi:diguanylate cyclase (GGDEF)-like protein